MDQLQQPVPSSLRDKKEPFFTLRQGIAIASFELVENLLCRPSSLNSRIVGTVVDFPDAPFSDGVSSELSTVVVLSGEQRESTDVRAFCDWLGRLLAGPFGMTTASVAHLSLHTNLNKKPSCGS